jgi:meso-butanediol dehydrogenase/(S,S)-butanediol dehydrogenase/diacetyl reductase
MHLLDVTEENWHSIMDVNALGTLIGIQEGARRMIPRRSRQDRQHLLDRRPQGYPSFAPVLGQQVRGQRAHPGRRPGAGRARHHLQRLRPRRGRHPAVGAPGRRPQAIGDAESPGRRWRTSRRHPARPRRHAEDLVGTALFLASPDSDYITGQVLMADGGMVLV